MQDAEELTVEEACKVAKAACAHLATWDLELALAAAARAIERLENKCKEFCVMRRAVHVYTQDSRVYKELNRRLKLRERESLDQYCQGDDLVWWAVSSATSTAAVLNNDTFLGQVGERTLFSIKVYRCVNIRNYSAIGHEDERLIIPFAAFHFNSHLPFGSGLTMIQLRRT